MWSKQPPSIEARDPWALDTSWSELDSRFVYLSAGYESHCKAWAGTESTEFNCSVIDHQPRSQCTLGMNVPGALHKMSVSGLASPSTRLSASRPTGLTFVIIIINSVALLQLQVLIISNLRKSPDRSIHTEYMH
ncbi:uncharacterized protein P174DRAFT_441236 [Aspergillus novofumigatus IBT 16806]|uniref:Uncharacterized protein n=1 Tax=Aspergillus novofumigatus (strain IBT 16806) TaxID=1392255 RepID=A0A2I1C8J5_ASPN1|nr:uncharacterized protein P174DRAFT_441236 [Aspergillus novofumigatus IBT 16806]PKX93974.1 hypothetical protein P174DRAFT_441236 [Aspergillus novofumigatus IBT 16806]